MRKYTMNRHDLKNTVAELASRDQRAEAMMGYVDMFIKRCVDRGLSEDEADRMCRSYLAGEPYAKLLEQDRIQRRKAAAQPVLAELNGEFVRRLE